MRQPSDPVIIFSDGRKMLTRRDLIVDNEITRRREFYNMDRTEVTSWMSMEMLCQKSLLNIEPWGTYSPLSES